MHLSLLPWDVREEHRDTHIHRMLERESLRRAGLPYGTAEEVRELEAWTAALTENGAVVDYRPQTERGFVLVFSAPGGGEDLIRRPAGR